MNNFTEILDYIVNNESKKTVGILLKRIELLSEQAKKEHKDTISLRDLELLKMEQKELIYEAYRNLRDFLKTGTVVFEISQKKEQQ